MSTVAGGRPRRLRARVPRPWTFVGAGLPAGWVAGHIPWPAVAEVAGNLVRPIVSEGLHWSEALYGRENLAAGANRERALIQLHARTAGGPAWLSALDAGVRYRADGKVHRLRDRFAAYRRAGVRPHPMPAELDEVAAALVVNAVWAAEPDSGSPEASAVPDDRLGVAQGVFTRVTPTTSEERMDEEGWGRSERVATGVEVIDDNGTPGYPGDDTAYTGSFQSSNVLSYGTFADCAADIAAAGLGRIRRAKQVDLYWGSLFPAAERDADFPERGAIIPPPAEILENIRADEFAVLGATALMIETCLALGVKIDLTLFSGGGGMNLSYVGAGDAGRISEADPDDEGSWDAPPWSAVRAGGPPWQVGSIVFSEGSEAEPYSWHPYYHDDANYMGFGSAGGATATAQLYQRWVLNVWPTGEDPRALGFTTEYQRECARRKSLAVAAFCSGVAEWLEGVWNAAATDGISLDSSVEVMEASNELNAFWQMPPWQLGSPPAVWEGPPALEAGRFIALLTGPVQARLPWLRFRTEVASWNFVAGDHDRRIDSFEASCTWLRDTLRVGVAAEVEWWRVVEEQRLLRLSGLPTAPEADAWDLTCAGAEFYWPPRISDGIFPTRVAGNLIQEVGFHFFHGFNADEDGVGGPEYFADTSRLMEDIAAFDRRVVRGTPGFKLAATCGAFLFPAVDPGDPRKTDTGSFGGPIYLGTNDVYQAGMVLRLGIAMLASGLRFAGVFTHVSGISTNKGSYEDPQLTGWYMFSADGIRNDVVARGGTYDRAEEAWPRPVWFALRRFSWLLGQGGTLSTVVSEDGLFVVHLSFPMGLSQLPDGSPPARPWRGMYIAWLEDSTPLHGAFLSFRGPTDYELLPPSPGLRPSTGSEGLDARGFARPANVTWYPTGWAGVAPELAPRGRGQPRLGVALQRSDPLDAPLPLYLLTDATFTSWSSRPTDVLEWPEVERVNGPPDPSAGP